MSYTEKVYLGPYIEIKIPVKKDNNLDWYEDLQIEDLLLADDSPSPQRGNRIYHLLPDNKIFKRACNWNAHLKDNSIVVDIVKIYKNIDKELETFNQVYQKEIESLLSQTFQSRVKWGLVIYVI